jgi:endoglucanase
MNKSRNPNSTLYVAVLFLLLLLTACDTSDHTVDENIDNIWPDAYTVIKQMASGFNLGNTFDNGLQSTDPETIYPIIDLYTEAGMRHIRIPVTWMEGFDGNALADSTGNVNFDHPRFQQLQNVIDYSLSKGLYVVINAHHERRFKDEYDGSEKFDNAFTSLWTDIANYFKDYPYRLIFELLNEPGGNFGAHSGGINPLDSIAIARTRWIYKIGTQAVRDTGGNNTNRVIMISTNGMGNHIFIKEVYPTTTELPGMGGDPYLSIQVHTYDPWSFCGQNGTLAEYPGKLAIEKSIQQVAQHARSLGVPVNYGEFGVGRANNQAERSSDTVKEFYQTVVQTTLNEDMSSSVWDDRGWFGLVDDNEETKSLEFIYDIVPMMLQNTEDTTATD